MMFTSIRVCHAAELINGVEQVSRRIGKDHVTFKQGGKRFSFGKVSIQNDKKEKNLHGNATNNQAGIQISYKKVGE